MGGLGIYWKGISGTRSLGSVLPNEGSHQIFIQMKYLSSFQASSFNLKPYVNTLNIFVYSFNMHWMFLEVRFYGDPGNTVPWSQLHRSCLPFWKLYEES